MINWSQQPRDVANLFNPAFMGELARRTGTGYRGESGVGIPTVLVFLAAPLAFYPDARRTLNHRNYRSLHTWVVENPEVRISLARRVSALSPHVRLGLAFALAHRTLAIEDDGTILVLPRRRRSGPLPEIESRDFFSSAEKIGRLFARVQQPFNIFLTLGLEP